MANVSMIVAHDLQRAIGYKNKLLWNIPSDMAIFRRVTKGKAVLMGRNTAISVGRALPKRLNLVLTHQSTAPYDDQVAVRSIDEAIAHASEAGVDLVIIGGEQVYRLAMPYVQTIHASVVKTEVPQFDTVFPDLDPDFQRTHYEAVSWVTDDDYPFSYEIWERAKS